jgi:hypothetical protein
MIDINKPELKRLFITFVTYCMPSMKKSTILFLLLLSISVQAQYKPVVFGIRIAPNIGWLKSDQQNYEGQGIKPGYSWGFVSEFFLMENYAIQTGFNVVNINGGLKYPHAIADADSSLIPGTLSRDYMFRYLEIPFTFKMHADIGERSRLFAKIGLGTGFRLRVKAEDTFEYEGGEEREERTITEDVKLIRNSLIVGGGYQFSIKGSTSLVVEVVYNEGFIDVLKGSNTADPSIDHEAMSKFLELGIGILF